MARFAEGGTLFGGVAGVMWVAEPGDAPVVIDSGGGLYPLSRDLAIGASGSRAYAKCFYVRAYGWAGFVIGDGHRNANVQRGGGGAWAVGLGEPTAGANATGQPWPTDLADWGIEDIGPDGSACFIKDGARRVVWAGGEAPFLPYEAFPADMDLSAVRLGRDMLVCLRGREIWRYRPHAASFGVVPTVPGVGTLWNPIWSGGWVYYQTSSGRWFLHRDNDATVGFWGTLAEDAHYPDLLREGDSLHLAWSARAGELPEDLRRLSLTVGIGESPLSAPPVELPLIGRLPQGCLVAPYKTTDERYLARDADGHVLDYGQWLRTYPTNALVLDCPWAELPGWLRERPVIAGLAWARTVPDPWLWGVYVGAEGGIEGERRTAFEEELAECKLLAIARGVPLYLLQDNPVYPWGPFLAAYAAPRAGLEYVLVTEFYPVPGTDDASLVALWEANLKAMAAHPRARLAAALATYDQSGNWDKARVAALHAPMRRLAEAYGLVAVLPFSVGRPSGAVTYPAIFGELIRRWAGATPGLPLKNALVGTAEPPPSAPPPSPPTPPPADPRPPVTPFPQPVEDAEMNMLKPGQQINVGQQLDAKNGFHIKLQEDGNFTRYGPKGPMPGIFQHFKGLTPGRKANCVKNQDGVLINYDDQGESIADGITNKANDPYAIFILRDNGEPDWLVSEKIAEGDPDFPRAPSS